jgi:LmbE family N-acetylglucosaminyl deacetylase
MRVLGVGAHPDDLEILCGGTLARYVQEGHEVVMCHGTKGNRGSFEHTSEEIAEIRGREARQAAEICGAEYTSLGFDDAEVNASDPDQQIAVIEMIREARPDVIITHFPEDYMGDHNEISRLVFDCSFYAALPLYETGRPYHTVIPPIFYMETIMGHGFQPTEFVDVTSTIETKVEMLEAHQSQLTWLKQHNDVDIVEEMRTMTRFRGQQCAVEYAEGFRPCLVHLRARTTRLLP